MPRLLVPIMSTVECPLEGYEGVTVSYNVNARGDKVREAQAAGDTKRIMQLLFVKIEGWDLVDEEEDSDGNTVQVPVPVPSIENSMESGTDIFIHWLIREGFQEAVRKSVSAAAARQRD